MTEQELSVLIGARVAYLRKEKGLSQSELAALIESEKQNISRLERGLVNPGVHYLYKIADALDCTLSELLELDEI